MIPSITALLICLVGCTEEGPLKPPMEPIEVPAVSIEGRGLFRIGEVNIRDGLGSCEVWGAPIPALVYETTFWTDHGITVFHVVAPAADNLHVLYVYSAADTLRSIWHESYTDRLSFFSARGTALYDGSATVVRPDLNPLTSLPDSLDLLPGEIISGSEIHYAHGSGSIEIGLVAQRLYPFEWVDCSDCGSDAGSGWYELHAMLAGPGEDIGFGILYLFLNLPERVYLHYHLRFNPLRHGSHAIYDASWSIPATRLPASGPWLAAASARLRTGRGQ